MSVAGVDVQITFAHTNGSPFCRLPDNVARHFAYFAVYPPTVIALTPVSLHSGASDVASSSDIEYNSNNDMYNNPYFIQWNGGISVSSSLEILSPYPIPELDSLVNNHRGIPLQFKATVPTCICDASELTLLPVTELDWNILSTQTDAIENCFLRQINLVRQRQRLRLYITPSLHVDLIVTTINTLQDSSAIDSNSIVARVSSTTDVSVVPPQPTSAKPSQQLPATPKPISETSPSQFSTNPFVLSLRCLPQEFMSKITSYFHHRNISDKKSAMVSNSCKDPSVSAGSLEGAAVVDVIKPDLFEDFYDSIIQQFEVNDRALKAELNSHNINLKVGNLDSPKLDLSNSCYVHPLHIAKVTKQLKTLGNDDLGQPIFVGRVSADTVTPVKQQGQSGQADASTSRQKYVVKVRVTDRIRHDSIFIPLAIRKYTRIYDYQHATLQLIRAVDTDMSSLSLLSPSFRVTFSPIHWSSCSSSAALLLTSSNSSVDHSSKGAQLALNNDSTSSIKPVRVKFKRTTSKAEIADASESVPPPPINDCKPPESNSTITSPQTNASPIMSRPGLQRECNLINRTSSFNLEWVAGIIPAKLLASFNSPNIRGNHKRQSGIMSSSEKSRISETLVESLYATITLHGPILLCSGSVLSLEVANALQVSILTQSDQFNGLFTHESTPRPNNNGSFKNPDQSCQQCTVDFVVYISSENNLKAHGSGTSSDLFLLDLESVQSLNAPIISPPIVLVPQTLSNIASFLTPSDLLNRVGLPKNVLNSSAQDITIPAAIKGQNRLWEDVFRHIFLTVLPIAVSARVEANVWPYIGALITGPRASGKTFLLKHISEYIIRSERLACHVETYDCINLKNSSPQTIFDTLSEIYDRAFARTPAVICLDNLDHIAPQFNAERAASYGLGKDHASFVGIHINNLLLCCHDRAMQQHKLATHQLSNPKADFFSLRSIPIPFPLSNAHLKSQTTCSIDDEVVSVALEGSVFTLATAESTGSVNHRLLHPKGMCFECPIAAIPAAIRREILSTAVREYGGCLEGELMSEKSDVISNATQGFRAGELVMLGKRCAIQCLSTQSENKNTSISEILKIGSENGSINDYSLTSLSFEEVIKFPSTSITTSTSDKQQIKFIVSVADFIKCSDNFPSISSSAISRSQQRKITFDQVSGYNRQIEALKDMFLLPRLYPQVFKYSPIRLSRASLLFGPSGCGKTQLAYATAYECNFDLRLVRGPELLDKYIGASERAVRELFEKAAETGRSTLILFDEFDAMAPRRGKDNSGVTDRVVNQLLTMLDGVETIGGPRQKQWSNSLSITKRTESDNPAGESGSDGLEGDDNDEDNDEDSAIYILATSSRPDMIDPALLRPGRIDRHIFIGYPSLNDRRDILLNALRPYIPSTGNAVTGVSAYAKIQNSECLTTSSKSPTTSSKPEGIELGFNLPGSDTLTISSAVEEIITDSKAQAMTCADLRSVVSSAYMVAVQKFLSSNNEVDSVSSLEGVISDNCNNEKSSNEDSYTSVKISASSDTNGLLRISADDLMSAYAASRPAITDNDRQYFNDIYAQFQGETDHLTDTQSPSTAFGDKATYK